MRERQSIDDVREEIGSGGDAAGDDQPTDDAAAVGVGSLTETERAEVNDLFDLLHEHGYLTAGPWQISSDGEGHKSLTVTAVLPSSVAAQGHDPDDLVADDPEGDDA